MSALVAVCAEEISAVVEPSVFLNSMIIFPMAGVIPAISWRIAVSGILACLHRLNRGDNGRDGYLYCGERRDHSRLGGGVVDTESSLSDSNRDGLLYWSDDVEQACLVRCAQGGDLLRCGFGLLVGLLDLEQHCNDTVGRSLVD